MTVSLDKDLLETMTPEERAEIEGAEDSERASLAATGAEKDPQHTAGNVAAPDKPGDEDDEDDDDDADAEGTAAAAADAPAEGAAAAPAPAPAADASTPAEGDQAAAAAPAPAPTAPAASDAQATPSADDPLPLGAARAPAPVYTYELPADFDERMAGVRTAQETLLDRFESGELTREELRTEQENLAEQRRELDSMRNRAEVAADMNQQAQANARDQLVGALFDAAAKPEHGGIDYRKDKAKLDDLDLFVKRLAADDANADKPLEWFLNEAHKRVRVLHGVAPAPAPVPAPAPAATKTAAQIKAEAAAARKPNIPNDVDLSALPGGSDASDVDGEFSDIYALEGDAYEDAIAKMARTQPERFARFQSGMN